LISDRFKRLYSIQSFRHTRCSVVCQLIRLVSYNKIKTKKELNTHLFFFSIMIRLSYSFVILALIATVYSTDYFVEKFEGTLINLYLF
jgi:hypothetical protein